MNNYALDYAKGQKEAAKDLAKYGKSGFFPNAIFVHSSMCGSYDCDCEVIKKVGKTQTKIRYIDPLSKETCFKNVLNEELTMKDKKEESPKQEIVTFEVPSDLYFKMLKVCLDNKWTIDEFVTKAMKDFVERYGKMTSKQLKELKKQLAKG